MGSLDDIKEERRRTRRPIGTQSVLLQLLAYGGMAAIAAGLVLALVNGRPDAPPPPVPLHGGAGEAGRGARRLPDGPGREEAPVPEVRAVAAPDAPTATPTPTPGAATAPTPPAPTPRGGVIVAAPEEALTPPVPPAPTPPPATPVKPTAAAGPTPPTGPTTPSGPTAEGAAPPVAASPASGGPTVDDKGCKLYPVMPGDATATVARRLSVGLKDLRAWNPELASAGPKPGTKLRVCHKKKAIVGWTPRTVKVAPGQTVLRIAREADLSIENVCAVNGIHPDKVQAGQKLTVFAPVWQ